MMTIEEFARWCAKKQREFPELTDFIAHNYYIARDEIEDSGNPDEILTAMEAINQVIEELL
jgi:hypothetical protein